MITSVSNKQVKNIIQLTKKSKIRKETNQFVVEGIKMFQEAPKEAIRQIYVSESFLAKDNHKDILGDCKYEVMQDFVFQAASDTKTPQGILCIIEQFHYNTIDIIRKNPAHIIVLEDLQDPGNLGTILRAGEGAGITGVILSKNCVDIYNPKTIRSTMGSIYRVPFVYVEDLKKTVEELKRNNIEIYAAHLKQSQDYDKIDLTKSHAFMIGNEGNGLSDEISSIANSYLKIPMEGEVESLNAAIAASILMYETARQRRNL
ncbi:TrmH family RNA methyltransferase [Candidatus Galacturonibacter soehngenii]|uniref:RNA methyltransferase n=1 Tax=Candidatus Galacturonatibacter soehngenii TaxID=2307010 RepID=A0A7V7UC74_9FIRM|nr:RNA methyltransferase [Candidatus Galacturonibacter soehngenii]KAB1438525.1 RNA methyltransferase [Candidatus Galacturonibacter soehngenii]MBA4685559.1 RNA methyltransferase [Candidatus Galacturonibacter soehngenii]